MARKRAETIDGHYYCMCGMWFIFKRTLDLHIQVSKPKFIGVFEPVVFHSEITHKEWLELKP